MGVWLDGSNTAYIYELVSGVWTDRSSGGITLGSTPADAPQSVNFAGNWYIALGTTDLLVLLSGASSVVFVDSLQSNAALEPPDDPKLLAVNADRLFMANVLDVDTGERVPFRLHWCDHLRPNVWSYGQGAGTADYLDLAEDNEPITAIHTYSDTITVFKPRLIYAGRFVGGSKVFDFRPLVDGPGCVAADTLQRWRDAKFVFLGDENVYISRPGEPPQGIGDAIRTRIRATVDLDNISKSKAVVDWDNDLYWLFMPKLSGGEVRVIFVCNLRNGAWFEGELESEDEITAALQFREKYWGTLQFLGTSGGKVYNYTFSATDDDGEAFTSSWESGTFSIEQMTSAKSQQGVVEMARAFSESSSGNVTLEVDTGDTLDEFDTTAFGTQTFGTSQENLLTERSEAGEFFRLRLLFNTIASAAHIQGLSIGIIYKGDTHR